MQNSLKLPSWAIVSSYAAATLVLLALLLFISKSLYNYPVSLLALFGLIACFTSRGRVFSQPSIRCFCLLFACIWLPILLSLSVAVNFERSLDTVGPYLRFLFMGVFVIWAMSQYSTQRIVLLGIFCLVSFWCIDAIVQVLFGIDFFGHPYEDRHITGMFYPKNTIAHICAGLSPIYFELIRRNYQNFRPALIMLLPLFAVILLSGRRAAWIMLALSCSGYLGFYLLQKTQARLKLRQVVLLLLVMLTVLGSIVATHDATRRRLTTSLGIFSGDYEVVNKATAKRLPLWQTSILIAREHWLLGVGARGYRYVYSEYAREDDEWKSSGQTHPHQLLLEVLVESGLIGLLGLLCFTLVFFQHMKAAISRDPTVFPWGLAVVVIIFPINTHMAFYGSYWSSFFWILVTLALSSGVHSAEAHEARDTLAVSADGPA